MFSDRNIKYLIAFVFLLFLAGEILSQSRVCAGCGKEITGSYIEADGKYFHPGHFRCDYCGKPIEGSFNKEGGKYYHRECARKYLLPVCDVCGEPLEGRYFQDLYDNRYHPAHREELPRCDNCDRLICERITGGGKRFSDGRDLCNLCLSSSVKSESTYEFLLQKVASKVKGFGLSIDMRNVTVNPVDRIGLKAVAGNGYNENIKGFCNITTETTEFNGRTDKNVTYDIYVLNRIPSIYVEATLAHELMHVWLAQNTENNQSDELTEGSCHFIAYKYLLLNNSDTASKMVEFLVKDTNPVYGGGLRKILSRFNNKYLVELLSYLKNNRTL